MAVVSTSATAKYIVVSRWARGGWLGLQCRTVYHRMPITQYVRNIMHNIDMSSKLLKIFNKALPDTAIFVFVLR